MRNDQKLTAPRKKVRAALVRAINATPEKTQVALGTAIQASQQRIAHWLKVGRVSPLKAPKIEEVTGVRRQELCPDVEWGVSPSPNRTRFPADKRAEAEA